MIEYKHNMRYLLVLLVALSLANCANDLDLITDAQEIPVVYGIIDPADTAQYIRVERVFVDPVTSANVIAQNPDSLYYDDITVKLVRVANGVEYILERVDGNLEGFVRDTGIFAQTPNYLYKVITEDINFAQGSDMQLRIEGVYEDRDVTASAPIFRPPFFVSPQIGGLIAFERNKFVAIGWQPQGDVQPAIYTALFNITVRESKLGVSEVKTLTWVAVPSTTNTMLEIDGVEFFSFLRGALTIDPQTTRTITNIEFQLISGSESINDYIRVGQANLGITSSGEVPVFSNLSEGLGLFGSRYTESRTGLRLTDMSRDSLMVSPITAALNFQ